MEPEIRFLVADDGARIAWRAEGDGPLVVFCNGIANDAFQFGAMLARLRGAARLVTWDYPGHGASDPAADLDGLDIPAVVRALMGVLEAAGGGPATLVGYSVGCQVALEACRHAGDRVAGVVCLLGTPGRPFDSFYGPVLGKIAHQVLVWTPGKVMGAALDLGQRAGPVTFALGRGLGIIEPTIRYADWAPWLRHLGAIDGPSFRAIALSAQRHTAEDVLPSLGVPLLVVGGGKDAFTPPRRSRQMHDQAPGSESLLLPEATHSGLVGHAFETTEAVAGFLARNGLLAAR